MQKSADDANAKGGDARIGARTSGTESVRPAPGPEIGVRPDGDRVVVAVRGELDLESAEQLEHALRAALGAAVGGVDLELGGVAFCDCSALNVLLGLRDQGLKQGKTVALRTVGPAVERLLTLTGTRTLFDTPCSDDDGDGGSDDRGEGRRAGASAATAGDSALQDLRIEVVQLRRAMQTRPVIDLARGILMASFGLSVEEAWRVLVLASQNTNTKLHHLAHDLVLAVRGDPPADAVQEQVAAAVAKVRSQAAPLLGDGSDRLGD
ncbi:anti-sigma factor antagonist [Streptomyces sp. ME18-1-4]|uniref:anti-sigma factor antagonist n=1 Tax=Streptomyces sp. ME18-1-4 TaxID=3028685 RepID=UPI0029A3F1D3|nr:anti-sigma factor antagonist [Streptomyces sp. ME18-1-4]MDX3246455.1 anti-sigma factor antagonist [Streptomyces sp. ME18-1-4]